MLRSPEQEQDFNNNRAIQIETVFAKFKPRLQSLWKQFKLAENQQNTEDAAFYKEQAFGLISHIYVDLHKQGLLTVDTASNKEPTYFLAKVGVLISYALDILDEALLTEMIEKALTDISQSDPAPRNLLVLTIFPDLIKSTSIFGSLN